MHSLINKMDSLRVWSDMTDAVLMVSTETWLKASISNDMIHIDAYNTELQI